MQLTTASSRKLSAKRMVYKLVRFGLLSLFFVCQCVYSVEPQKNISSLNIYEVATNRNFKIDIDQKAYYVRIGRENPEEVGINREEEIKHYIAAEKLGLTPKLHGYHLESGLLITEFIHGTSPSEEMIHEKETLDQIVKNLHDLHHYPYSTSNEPENTVFKINDTLLAKAKSEINLTDLSRWMDIRNTFEKDYYNNIPLGLCHADLFRGNILIADDGKVFFIDWEYSYYGHVIDDLGKLCSANWLTSEEMEALSKNYWKRMDPILLKRLKQNVFMQQFNFYLWCHIQAASGGENTSMYHAFSKMVRKHLNKMSSLLSSEI